MGAIVHRDFVLGQAKEICHMISNFLYYWPEYRKELRKAVLKALKEEGK